jgi:hypothetical protein
MGMPKLPGAMMPDALVFPPSKGVIQAFLDSGYYFSSSSDLWWFLIFQDGKIYHYFNMFKDC